MNLTLSAEDEAFRQEVRRFFERDYPRAVLDKLRNGQKLSREDHVASQQALQSRGWLAVGWPTEHGGPGWTPMQRYLFDEELERAGAPNLIPMALIYVGPIICAFGTPEQQRRWLPDILESRAMWAQGYSEPESGSDLASLGLSAVREGDEYVLNGTKIWTSGAHWADWIFCLVRTSREAKKQEGISFLCADMRSPGIAVRPIISIDGSHELNRVEFDNVRVPVENRIGEEGKGWHYANVLLKNERLSYAHVGRKKVDLERARALARTLPAGDGGALAEDPAVRAKLAAAEIENAGLEAAVLRALAGEVDPAAVSGLKILVTEGAQHITELFLDLAGDARLPALDRSAADWREPIPDLPAFAVPATADYFFQRAQTIYGGATEVQKNIIWRAIGR